MAKEFPLLSVIGTPGTLARLAKCCRSFRVIFLHDEVWEALCTTTIDDVSSKGPSVSWHDFYGNWVLSARAWFQAYSHLAEEIVRDPSFSMRVEFGGKNLPDEWREAECLCMDGIGCTAFGVTGEVHMRWSDMDDEASLPKWTYGNSQRITQIRVIGSWNGSSYKVVEIDCAESGTCALDFARVDEAKCAGFKIDHMCFCEDGVNSDDEGYGEHWSEDLSIAVQIPSPHFLEAMMGQKQMKLSAAMWLDRSLTARVDDTGPMLFAEVRSAQRYMRDSLQIFDSDEEQPRLASLASSIPAPSWYNPQHAFHFRRLYGHQLQAWKRDSKDNLPMPGYKFSFDFSRTKTTSRDRFLMSLWCLDPYGNTTFAHHFIPCTTKSKFKCSLETPSVVTPNCGCHYFVGEVKPSTEVSVGFNGDSNEFELASLNLMMVPFVRIEGFDRGASLKAVIMDYGKRLVHRLILHTHPEVAKQVNADELAEHCSIYCQSQEPDLLAGKLCSCTFEDFDIMSEDSDGEEERVYWRNRRVCEQEKLISETSEARNFEPRTVWVSSMGEDGKFGPSQERVLTEADRPTVSRKPKKGSVWHGMAPLKRCQRCRCILTGLQDPFQRDGNLYRNFCFKCQT
eukprot:gnl/MRDRNA2_/MRDRNA2_109145_c0_seq1.p1 gnl/MRDRNA2_/MRDRNA2_109145_c0~~gnl/MRDRNA2_/MRDRNA2_109145_c0_seq1.p1  ORF type:complete len:657 (+),score=85.63 gnl/MRDRNA2_/MRDRNA2_109145_c0_seq1:108-1973(+)